MHDMTKRRRWVGSHTRSRLAVIGGVAGATLLAGGVTAVSAEACSTSSACKAGKDWNVTGSTTRWATSGSTIMQYSNWAVANWTTERSVVGLWAMWDSTSSWVNAGAWMGYLPGAASTSTPTWYKGSKDASGTVTYADLSANMVANGRGAGPTTGSTIDLTLGESGGCWTATLRSVAASPMCGFPSSSQHLFAGIEGRGTSSSGFKLKGSGSEADYAGPGGPAWTGATNFTTSGSGYCSQVGAPPDPNYPYYAPFSFATDNMPC